MKQFAIKLLEKAGLARPVERATRPLRWIAKRRTMRRFYRPMIHPGDLVFDIGANIGDWAAVFVQLQSRVVAVEPQADCVRILHKRFRNTRPPVAIVPAGAGASIGTAELTTSDTSNQLSSMSTEFIERSRFSQDRWGTKQTVAITTLDRLIHEHGVPAFCKIDVEGFEPEVLMGLSQPIRTVSFEFMHEFLPKADACMKRLETFGPVQFNVTLFPAWKMVAEQWMDRQELLERIDAQGPAACGDIYARSRIEIHNT